MSTELEIPRVEHILVLDGCVEDDWEKGSVGRGDYGMNNGLRGYNTGRFAYREGFYVEWVKCTSNAQEIRSEFVEAMNTYKAVSKEKDECGRIINIGNPGVLKLLAAYDQPSKYVFVFEGCSEALRERMLRQKILVPLESAMIITWQITDAIKFLHKCGVGGTRLNLNSVIMKHAIGWTPVRVHQFYKVCEPCEANENMLSFKEDNFRIGLIMHLMLTGRDPFDNGKNHCSCCVNVQLCDIKRKMVLRCEDCLKGMLSGAYKRSYSRDLPDVARNLMENIMVGDSASWLGPAQIIVHPFFSMYSKQIDHTS